ncbi:cyclin-dependent protein kinase inhibitor SMR3-like [Hibiscus syriacus]|uniref:Cyclin-dependent protein kinase inhibitor SMR3-like n=1 Tax=Hibiscus syriacus TaxID=106335 RepID=A0A6A3D3A4_HIBSY|nr:cyclin-dependent protein kinase inhibitor SMR3-like [Hibiscus syriacus]
MRVRVSRPSSNHDHSGSASFNTILTASPSSSSDLDTKPDLIQFSTTKSLIMEAVEWCQHTPNIAAPGSEIIESTHVVLLSAALDSWSSSHDNNITFGSLIGVSSILELSKRSVRGKKAEATKHNRINNNKRSKVWVFSLCLRDNVDVESDNTVDVPSSLGHFLAAERRAASGCRRNHSPNHVQNLRSSV